MKGLLYLTEKLPYRFIKVSTTVENICSGPVWFRTSFDPNIQNVLILQKRLITVTNGEGCVMSQHVPELLLLRLASNFNFWVECILWENIDHPADPRSEECLIVSVVIVEGPSKVRHTVVDHGTEIHPLAAPLPLGLCGVKKEFWNLEDISGSNSHWQKYVP